MSTSNPIADEPTDRFMREAAPAFEDKHKQRPRRNEKSTWDAIHGRQSIAYRVRSDRLMPRRSGAFVAIERFRWSLTECLTIIFAETTEITEARGKCNIRDGGGAVRALQHLARMA